MSNNKNAYSNLGYNKDKMQKVNEEADYSRVTIGNDNATGAGRNLVNAISLMVPVYDIDRMLQGDTDRDTNKEILRTKELADKSVLIRDSYKAGHSGTQTKKEIEDIDKRTSKDAFTKQAPMQNQGHKYQKDYDDHNSIFNEFSSKAKKEQQVRADALTLYNAERDDKKVLNRGNALTHDNRTPKDGKEIDASVNRELGVNKMTNGTGRNVGSTLGKYHADNTKINQKVNEASAKHTASRENEVGREM